MGGRLFPQRARRQVVPVERDRCLNGIAPYDEFSAHSKGPTETTAWLGIRESNSEMSSQIIRLKVLQICKNPAEFWPQRVFAFELRRWGNAARVLLLGSRPALLVINLHR